jgi:hypothetical protein
VSVIGKCDLGHRTCEARAREMQAISVYAYRENRELGFWRLVRQVSTIDCIDLLDDDQPRSQSTGSQRAGRRLLGSLMLMGSKSGNIVLGAFTPVLAKHSKSFSLIDCISVGVDRMQRNFEPMRKRVEAWQQSELTDVTAKVVIYEAFVEGKLEAPKHLARNVHDLYFEPKYEEFRPRTIWSLSNAFTSAFKELDPIPQFKATANLSEFLEAQFSQSF